jgi:hypothetical protein
MHCYRRFSQAGHNMMLVYESKIAAEVIGLRVVIAEVKFILVGRREFKEVSCEYDLSN